MGKITNARFFEGVTDEDKRKFLDRQRQIRGAGNVPPLGVAGEYVDKTEGALTWTQFLEGLAECIGSPQRVTLKNCVLLIREPTVKELRPVLSRFITNQKLAETPDSEEVQSVVESLLVSCLEFTDGKPKDAAAWFDNLTATQALKLSAAFVRVFDVAEILRRVKRVQGKL